MPNLRKLAEADLARSGLGPKTIRSLGMEVLTAKQVARLDPSFKPLGALKINYYDPAGRPTGHYRLRYLETNHSIASATKAGTPRYVQPTGSPLAVYFTKGVAWEKVLADPSETLHLTEGEKKAAVGCGAGFSVLGLGGVWSWKSSKRGQSLIPDLAEIAWKGRQVYITVDSDAAVNQKVVQAQLALADELTALGAAPLLVTLPPGRGGAKVGLDDYILAYGRDAYEDLMVHAKPYSMARELWAMNTEVIFIRDPGFVLALKDGQRMAPHLFANYIYGNRHYSEQKPLKDGGIKIIKKPLAPEWVAWEQRATLSRLTYAPGEPAITAANEYNTWKGWGSEPAKGDVSLWRELLDHLFGRDREARAYFEKWCAYPLQHPGTKLYTAAVMWGVEQGTGKSLVGYSLMRIYGVNAAEIGESDLRGAFNEWAEAKQFIMGEEITGSDHRREADRLKGFITQKQLRINMKHIPTYTVPDRINYYFTSNHPDAFFLEDTDRRFFVHEVVGDPAVKDFYDRYDKWYKTKEGTAALFYHLLRVSLEGFSPTAAAPRTKAKENMIADTKSDLGTWVARLKLAPDGLLKLGDAPLQGDLFTTGELLQLYDKDGKTRVTANGLGRELKRAGFRYANGGSVVATVNGPQRLYIVRGRDKWHTAKPKQVAAHYNSRFTAPVEKKGKFK
jgi:hypothetical protein